MCDSSEVIFCRICLRTDLTRKYILSDIAQRKFMETFFKENGCYKDLDEYSYSCFECRSVLHRSYNFIQRAVRAQKVLYEMQEGQGILKYSWLKSLNREEYGIASKLACCEPKIYNLEPLDIKIPEENVTVKSETNEFQDDHEASDTKETSIVDATVAPNSPNIYLTNCENPNDNCYNNPYTRESSKIDSESIPNLLTKSYIESPCNEDTINSEPEVVLDENDTNIVEFNYDPLEIQQQNKHGKNKRKRKNTDDSFTHDTKPLQKEKPRKELTLDVLSSDDDITSKNTTAKKKKYKRVKWPAMPIFEERFRTRKSVNYSGLDDEREKRGEDFVPVGDNSSDASADVSCDSFDDKGRVMSRKEDKREFPMKCEECNSEITSKHDHYCHYVQAHRDIPYPYRSNDCSLCPDCGKIVTKNQLKVHEIKHAGENVECYICHKDYSCRRTMLEHQRRVHGTGRYNHTCGDCGKQFFAKCELKLHIRKNQLKVHEIKHAGEKVECYICHKDYSCRRKMLEHQRRVHGTGRYNHTCGDCGKQFFAKSELKLHVRTHTGEKPFKCHLCDHRVAHKGNLDIHIRQVHQNNPVKVTNKRKSKKNGKNEEENSRKKIVKKDKRNSKVTGNHSEENKRKVKGTGQKKKKVKRKVTSDSETFESS